MTKDASFDGWIAGLCGPKKWRADDARRVLAAWKDSGLSMSAFGHRHGFDAQRMAWWRGRVPTTAMTLVPVKVREVVAPVRNVAPVSLVIDEDVRIDVADPARVSPAWLAMVAGALSRRSA